MKRMNKSDLKSGMKIELRNKKILYVLYTELLEYSTNCINQGIYMIKELLSNYNDDLIHINNKEYDIMKVYKEYDINPIWERQEIDWKNIPKDTKVYVSDCEGGERLEKRYFRLYSPEDDYPFSTYLSGQTCWSSEGKYRKWKYCELAEGEYERLKEEGIL